MQRELIEHAARVLECTQGRAMPADSLYERVAREAGLNVGLARLLDCVRSAADRFVLLPPSALALDESGWETTERSLYADALTAAGLSTAPVVMLAERVAGAAYSLPDTRAGGQPTDAAAGGVGGPVASPSAGNPGAVPAAHGDAAAASLLAELHDALTEVLRAAGGDADLCRLVSGSMASIDEVNRHFGESR